MWTNLMDYRSRLTYRNKFINVAHCYPTTFFFQLPSILVLQARCIFKTVAFCYFNRNSRSRLSKAKQNVIKQENIIRNKDKRSEILYNINLRILQWTLDSLLTEQEEIWDKKNIALQRDTKITRGCKQQKYQEHLESESWNSLDT